ncbi:MAG: DUF4255 domain-containing protein [Chitinophagales bacterium]|nr:DUF4255 domain-containing protein [Chitinophagales bacterium]
MIHQALTTIANALNAHLKSNLGHNEDIVALSALKSPDGSRDNHSVNKVAITLVNTAFDAAMRNLGYRTQGLGNTVQSPPMALNISMLVTSSFNDYHESLRFHDEVVAYFYQHPVHEQVSDKISKLTIEPLMLSYEDNRNIWQALGCSYMPSSVYMVRIIAA